MVNKTGLLAVVLAVTLAGSAVTAAVVVQEQQAAGNDFQNQTLVSVVHMSPDAPAVDVLFDNETVASNVSFGDATQYMFVESGTYNVTLVAADAAADGEATETPEAGTPTDGTPTEENMTSGDVLYETNVTLDARDVTSLVAQGEASEGAAMPFEVVAFSDDAWTPTEDEAALRVAHLSPDAPTVDVTAANGTAVLADNVSFGDDTEYATVPAGNYTVEIREASADNNGSIVTTVDVTLDGEQAYTAWAAGYAAPEEAAANQSLQVYLTEDASASVDLPGDQEVPPTPNATATETPGEAESPTTAANETATPMGEETASPMGEETASPMGNETATPGAETESPGAETETPGTATETPAEGEA